MNKKTYMNKDIVKISGLNRNTIRAYSMSKLVPATILDGAGTGSNRLYSQTDLLKFCLVPILTKAGLSLGKIRIVFEQLKRDLFSPSNGFLYHESPNRAFIGIYDADENLEARVVQMPDPDKCDRVVKDLMSENLKTFTVDMLYHKTCLVVDITSAMSALPKT